MNVNAPKKVALNRHAICLCVVTVDFETTDWFSENTTNILPLEAAATSSCWRSHNFIVKQSDRPTYLRSAADTSGS